MSRQTTVAPAPDQPQVEYRDIPDWPGYCVGNDGSVWSCKSRGRLTDSWHCLRPTPGNICGHLYVGFRGDGRRSVRTVHSLVLALFVGPRPDGRECCHRDGNPANNHVSNLYWGTRSDNIKDSLRHGTKPVGERHANAKLSEAQVLQIRQRASDGQCLALLAAEFNICSATVRKIRDGKNWKHLYCSQHAPLHNLPAKEGGASDVR